MCESSGGRQSLQRQHRGEAEPLSSVNRAALFLLLDTAPERLIRNQDRVVCAATRRLQLTTAVLFPCDILCPPRTRSKTTYGLFSDDAGGGYTAAYYNMIHRGRLSPSRPHTHARLG